MTSTTITRTIIALTCADCGTTFGLDAAYQRERRLDHQTFYCPNQHRNYYPQRSLKEERDDALRAAQEARAQTASLRAQNDRLATDLMDKSKELRRVNTRIRAGTCTLCHRNFKQLRNHMAKKHPKKNATK